MSRNWRKRACLLCFVFIILLVSLSFKVALANMGDDEDLVGLYFHNDLGNRSGNGTCQIFYQDAKTGNITQITFSSEYDHWWPRLSPDGSTLLCYRSPATGREGDYDNAELVAMDPDGSNYRVLIPKDPGPPYNWTAQGVVDWSPCGTKLIMAAHTTHWNIYITDIDGSNPVRISQRDSLYLDPSFSPCGNKIVCVAFPPDYIGTDLTKLEVYTMNINGTNEFRVTNDNIRDNDPYWSPDGEEIAWESEHGLLNWSIRAAKPDGTGLRTVVPGGFINVNTVPRWSKNSSYIYFHHTQLLSRWHIRRVNRDGSNNVQITYPPDSGEGGDAQAEPVYVELQ